MRLLFCLFHLCSLLKNGGVDILLRFACELIEEEGNSGQEHHNTVNDGIEEEKGYLGVKALYGIRYKVSGLNVADDGVFTVKDKGRKRACDGTADECTDADNEGEGGVKALACFKLNGFKDVSLEH